MTTRCYFCAREYLAAWDGKKWRRVLRKGKPDALVCPKCHAQIELAATDADKRLQQHGY